ncbi:MAG TPA: type II toxin-antitoxin system prevent-host-death family antitoxin [Terracidiphilus sp.]|nr:type II toxin-antitoxin system prevent-host-death family antitoxin [Terracidiphilus sp.]
MQGERAVVYNKTGQNDWLIMRTIQASEAKTRLLSLLDDVERGETIIITRHGKPIARIAPQVGEDREKVKRAIEDMRELRKKAGRLSVEEILSARDEGRA